MQLVEFQHRVKFYTEFCLQDGFFKQQKQLWTTSEPLYLSYNSKIFKSFCVISRSLVVLSSDVQAVMRTGSRYHKEISEQNLTLCWKFLIREAQIGHVTDLIDRFHCRVKFNSGILFLDWVRIYFGTQKAKSFSPKICLFLSLSASNSARYS